MPKSIRRKQSQPEGSQHKNHKKLGSPRHQSDANVVPEIRRLSVSPQNRGDEGRGTILNTTGKPK